MTESVASRVDEQVYRFLESEAERYDLTVSELVRRIINQYTESGWSVGDESDQNLEQRVDRLESILQINVEERQGLMGNQTETVLSYDIPSPGRAEVVIDSE